MSPAAVMRPMISATARFVAVFGGADEVVVGDVEELPETVVPRDHPIGELDGLDPLVAGRLFDLLTVLVGAGQK